MYMYLCNYPGTCFIGQKTGYLHVYVHANGIFEGNYREYSKYIDLVESASEIRGVLPTH